MPAETKQGACWHAPQDAPLMWQLHWCSAHGQMPTLVHAMLLLRERDTRWGIASSQVLLGLGRLNRGADPTSFVHCASSLVQDLWEIMHCVRCQQKQNRVHAGMPHRMPLSCGSCIGALHMARCPPWCMQCCCYVKWTPGGALPAARSCWVLAG